jgi:hypothetical protein
MADTNIRYNVSVVPWFLIFIIAKLAAVPGVVAWSWWWIFAPIIPIAVEVLKAIMRMSAA